ncbi:MAG: lipoprotein insertase outer membrane protein LolB [Thiohalorhabdus sp.]|uniref:lipoprotein insertase outer membrane protein LolB n=1 Tax=Thiohalorhabdus sp. TaxID=3094134 RepID=UPI0039813087
MRLGLLLAVGLAMVLAGCAALGPQPAEDRDRAAAAYRERAEALAAPDGWRMVARVRVEGPEESGQVRLHWTHQDRSDRLQVRNPFGQTVLEVRYGAQGMQVRDSRGRTYRGATARMVLQRRLGWRVPVESMARWALGLADEERLPEVLDDLGAPLELRSGPWRVTYGEYREVEGIRLPRDIRLEREGAEARLRVEQWDLRGT